MKLKLNEDEIKDLKNNVQNAACSLISSKQKVLPTAAWITMGPDGDFSHHHSWDEEPSYEIIVVSLSTPEGRKLWPLEHNQNKITNPYNIQVDGVASLIAHLEEQIKGFVDEAIILKLLF